MSINDLPDVWRSVLEAKDAEIERLRAELNLASNGWKSALGMLERAWQPIETAGHDGRYLWLSDGTFMRIGFWADERWADFERAKLGGPKDLLFVPTHWMLLPALPAKGGT